MGLIRRGDKYIVEVCNVDYSFAKDREVLFYGITGKFCIDDIERLEKFDADKYISIDTLRELTKLSPKERAFIFDGFSVTDSILSQYTAAGITKRLKKYSKDDFEYLNMKTLRKIVDLSDSIRKDLFDGEYELEKILERFSASYIKWAIDSLKE